MPLIPITIEVEETSFFRIARELKHTEGVAHVRMNMDNILALAKEEKEEKEERERLAPSEAEGSNGKWPNEPTIRHLM
jgi:hypothetical protein